MAKLRASWWRHPAVIGLLSGWLVGTVWFIVLVTALGRGESTWTEGGQLVHRRDTTADYLVRAPLFGIPWAVVGMIAGAVARAIPGPWVPAGAGVGVLLGGICSLATNPFDGWLFITMPVFCLSGALAGVCVGAIAGEFARPEEN